MAHPDTASVIETIGRLADEIARASPESAEKARQIAALAAEISCAMVDGTAIRDAIESETADSDLSDTQVRSTAEAVLRTTREIT